MLTATGKMSCPENQENHPSMVSLFFCLSFFLTLTLSSSYVFILSVSFYLSSKLSFSLYICLSFSLSSQLSFSLSLTVSYVFILSLSQSLCLSFYLSFSISFSLFLFENINHFIQTLIYRTTKAEEGSCITQRTAGTQTDRFLRSLQDESRDVGMPKLQTSFSHQ